LVHICFIICTHLTYFWCIIYDIPNVCLVGSLITMIFSPRCNIVAFLILYIIIIYRFSIIWLAGIIILLNCSGLIALYIIPHVRIYMADTWFLCLWLQINADISYFHSCSLEVAAKTQPQTSAVCRWSTNQVCKTHKNIKLILCRYIINVIYLCKIRTFYIPIRYYLEYCRLKELTLKLWSSRSHYHNAVIKILSITSGLIGHTLY
jgi:hypothetical protein